MRCLVDLQRSCVGGGWQERGRARGHLRGERILSPSFSITEHPLCDLRSTMMVNNDENDDDAAVITVI